MQDLLSFYPFCIMQVLSPHNFVTRESQMRAIGMFPGIYFILSKWRRQIVKYGKWLMDDLGIICSMQIFNMNCVFYIDKSLSIYVSRYLW